MKWKSILGILFLITSCQGSSSGPAAPPRPVFKTTDPSRLYFANMRSYYYARLEQPSEADHFELKLWPQQKQRPQLIPRIVNHWLRDEAYLFWQPNTRWEQAGLPLQLELEAEGQAPVRLEWSHTDTLTQQRIGLWLFEQLRTDKQVSVTAPLDEAPEKLFEDARERQALMTVLADYLRLIEYKKP